MSVLALPMEIVLGGGVLILALGGATAFFGMYYWDMKTKQPELHVFQAARKPPYPPIIAMVDLSGRFFMFNGVKEKKTDIKLKKDDYGLLLDPNMVSKMPKSRLEDGTQLLMYGVGFHFPTDPNGARTIVQLIRKIRFEYPRLNFIRDDIVLMELLTKSGTDLPTDIETVLAMYPDETVPDEQEMNRLGRR